MSLQRTRPSDPLQQIVSSFKHFEKKIDKLQNDVDYHGQTLNDLRGIVKNLSLNTVYNPDGKLNEIKLPVKKNTAIQYENYSQRERLLQNCNRKKLIEPLPSKTKAKICGTENSINKTSFPTVPANTEKKSKKRFPRPTKTEASRESNTLQNQKVNRKNRNSLITQ